MNQTRMASNDKFTDYKESGKRKCEQAKQINHGSKEALELYKSAIAWFKRASAEANDSDQVAQVEKNMATTTLEVANILNAHNGDDQEVFLYYRLSLEHYDKALQCGRPVKYPKWTSHLEKAYRHGLETALDFVIGSNIFPFDNKIGLIQSIIAKSKETYAKSICNFELGKLCFDGSTHESNSPKKQQLLNDCLQFLSGISEKQLMEKVMELRRQSSTQLRKMEACTSLEKGKEEFFEMEKDGDLNVDMMYAAIDCLRRAIVLARENYLELEAEANSYLGRLYDTVLNHKVKATDYYKLSIFLVASIDDDSIKQTDWYRQAQHRLEHFQNSATLRQTENTECYSGLDKDIRQIRQARQRYVDIDFLHFIMDSFPARIRRKPIPEKDKMQTMTKKELSRHVIRMVPMYHPDKQKDQDKDWTELCEDITKELNQIIDNSKK